MAQAPAIFALPDGTAGNLAGFDAEGQLADTGHAGQTSGGFWADSGGSGPGVFAHADSAAQATGQNSHADSTGAAHGDYSHADSAGIANGTLAHADTGGTASASYAHADSYGTANQPLSHANTSGTTNAALSHASGIGSNAYLQGQKAAANAQIITLGDAQRTLLVLSNQTTSDTPAELFADATTQTQRLVLPTSTSLYFVIDINATRADGLAFFGGTRQGMIYHDPSTGVALAGAVGTIGADIAAGDASGWVVLVDADTTDQALRITVTGDSSGFAINWVAAVRSIETIV